MADEKKRVVMVRCEFDGEGGVARHAEFDCNSMQLLVFVGETLEIAAKTLNEEPDKVAKMALFVGKFSEPAKDDESENGEES